MSQIRLGGASLRELMAAYEEAAAKHGQATEDSDPRTTHAQYKRIAAAWRELKRRGEEGRAALSRLMGHGDPYVRLWAASHVLEFAPEAAGEELQRLATFQQVSLSFSAEMTLKEWRAGRLRFAEEAAEASVKGIECSVFPWRVAPRYCKVSVALVVARSEPYCGLLK